ncbi:NAD(P)H-hydrate dehydratase [Candidimonas sp. SYP-B2681]|uniref:NAD(P)H-hydrate dehydratase n=1 Tax=Candidimonas sp. SYP-B2681 TaxID=2497686 RepID=UPI000F899E5F|nr:NAD(P)H-hydrate dehydratase [Candidimonas sp. SYP-B2681]RTZ47863.1 NAD(P)H-hydrate dehydratase [Candidimonas sp. SYP-B2681]
MSISSFNFKTALLTPLQMAAADKAAAEGGISGIALMEAAGSAVANVVGGKFNKRPVLVLCGPGNNGGDGFVAARHLRDAGWPVTLALLGQVDTLSGDAATSAASWSGKIEPLSLELLSGAGLVIDALFGAGLSRPLEEPVALLLQALINSRIPVCAVDVPSGVDGSSGEVLGIAAAAQITVTFFRKKPGHVLMPGKELCGEVIVADIGIPSSVLEPIEPATFENAPSLWLDAFPWPDYGMHKYQRGHVLVIGGEFMTGAARLSALAAARAGAGLVTLVAPASVCPIYATALTSVMVQPVANEEMLRNVLGDERKNVVVVGPGAGVSALTKDYVSCVLAAQRACVLDADAISVFASDPQSLFDAIRGPCVLTPHEGEFRRVFNSQGGKLERAKRAARQCGAVVVLKGSDTVIAAADGRAIINTNAPPDLATGGTGDVLSGLIAGLMAQGMEPFLAAAAAVWLHGEAATLFGPGLISEDLPQMLPRVLRRLKRRAGQQDRNDFRISQKRS